MLCESIIFSVKCLISSIYVANCYGTLFSNKINKQTHCDFVCRMNKIGKFHNYFIITCILINLKMWTFIMVVCIFHDQTKRYSSWKGISNLHGLRLHLWFLRKSGCWHDPTFKRHDPIILRLKEQLYTFI